MVKKEKNNFEIKQSQFMIIGFVLIIIGSILILSNYVKQQSEDRKEILKIQDFNKKQEIINENIINPETPIEKKQEIINDPKEEYIAIIKIPKIKLEKGICKKGDSCNRVSKNIQILDEADYPDVLNGNFILAGHSGNSKVAYFKNLHKLNIQDEIIVVYGGISYKYKVVNMYDIEKSGFAKIIRNPNINTLTLITCRAKTNNQIVIIAELIERS